MRAPDDISPEEQAYWESVVEDCATAIEVFAKWAAPCDHKWLVGDTWGFCEKCGRDKDPR